MICDEPETCSNCDDQIRHLPWTQDMDDGVNCQGENAGLCFAEDSVSDVWEMWDITLRDLVILDRNGYYFTRVNLTAINPDPEYSCTGNYETLKALLLSARER